jgi:hypothetical protein
VSGKSKKRKQLARDRDTAFHDARRLALDLARSHSSFPFDPMQAGVVLQPGEIAYRQLPALFNQLTGYGPFGWTERTRVKVLVTDRRAFMRWPDGSLISLWWNGVHGFEANLRNETLVLDYGDGKPRCLSGPTVPVIAVAGIAAIYGVVAMLRHPSIAQLRVQPHTPEVQHRMCSNCSRDTCHRSSKPPAVGPHARDGLQDRPLIDPVNRNRCLGTDRGRNRSTPMRRLSIDVTTGSGPCS